MTFCVEGKDLMQGSGIDIEELFEKTAGCALLFKGCPYECQIDLTITDDPSIKELNLQFRSIDKPTDVLSFPLLMFEAPGDYDAVGKDDPDLFDPDTGELMLGSIVISIDRARKQAGEYGHSLRREIAFLIVHSMLHLQGFDHIEENDRIIMEAAQKKILDDLNIPREAALEE